MFKKLFNIDWHITTMIRGKCTGVGCPIRTTCLRFTSKDYEKSSGWVAPPRGDDGYLPKECFLFISNAKFKPLQKPFDVED